MASAGRRTEQARQGQDVDAGTSRARMQTLSSEGVLDALKMILTDAPLNDVLHSVALLIEAHSEGLLCTIYLLDEDGLRLRFAAGPKLPDAYRVATDGVYIGPEVGSCGAAAYLRKPVFVADVLTPYVLVGHSFGGLLVRMYAAAHPRDVNGMVLVDSVHEDETAKWIALIRPNTRRQMQAVGADRVMGGDVDLKTSQDQMRAASWHTHIPLIVLSRGRASYNPDDYPPPLRELAAKGKELRIKMQDDLAALSTRSKHNLS